MNIDLNLFGFRLLYNISVKIFDRGPKLIISSRAHDSLRSCTSSSVVVQNAFDRLQQLLTRAPVAHGTRNANHIWRVFTQCVRARARPPNSDINKRATTNFFPTTFSITKSTRTAYILLVIAQTADAYVLHAVRFSRCAKRRKNLIAEHVIIAFAFARAL